MVEFLDPYGEEIDIYEACFQDMYEVMKLVKERFIRENNNENDNETEENYDSNRM